MVWRQRVASVSLCLHCQTAPLLKKTPQLGGGGKPLLSKHDFSNEVPRHHMRDLVHP
jgi:hypothetical protein